MRLKYTDVTSQRPFCVTEEQNMLTPDKPAVVYMWASGDKINGAARKTNLFILHLDLNNPFNDAHLYDSLVTGELLKLSLVVMTVL